MEAQKLYTKLLSLVFKSAANLSKRRLQQISIDIIELRQLLSCVVCCELLKDPFEPIERRCGHNVCRLCLRGRKRLFPRCDQCGEGCDYKSHEENKSMALLLLCYKTLCIHLYQSSLYAQLLPYPEHVGGGVVSGHLPRIKLQPMTTHWFIQEGSSYIYDMCDKFLPQHELPFLSSSSNNNKQLVSPSLPSETPPYTAATTPELPFEQHTPIVAPLSLSDIELEAAATGDEVQFASPLPLMSPSSANTLHQHNYNLSSFTTQSQSHSQMLLPAGYIEDRWTDQVDLSEALTLPTSYTYVLPSSDEAQLQQLPVIGQVVKMTTHTEASTSYKRRHAELLLDELEQEQLVEVLQEQQQQPVEMQLLLNDVEQQQRAEREQQQQAELEQELQELEQQTELEQAELELEQQTELEQAELERGLKLDEELKLEQELELKLQTELEQAAKLEQEQRTELEQADLERELKLDEELMLEQELELELLTELEKAAKLERKQAEREQQQQSELEQKQEELEQQPNNIQHVSRRKKQQQHRNHQKLEQNEEQPLRRVGRRNLRNLKATISSTVHLKPQDSLPEAASAASPAVPTPSSCTPLMNKDVIKAKPKSTTAALASNCRCGTTSVPGRCTCRNSRCPCYMAGRSCKLTGCKCHGCKNPHLYAPRMSTSSEEDARLLTTSDAVREDVGQDQQKLTVAAEADAPTVATTVTATGTGATPPNFTLVPATQQSQHPLVYMMNETGDYQGFNIFNGNAPLDPAQLGFPRVPFPRKDGEASTPEFMYFMPPAPEPLKPDRAPTPPAATAARGKISEQPAKKLKNGSLIRNTVHVVNANAEEGTDLLIDDELEMPA